MTILHTSFFTRLSLAILLVCLSVSLCAQSPANGGKGNQWNLQNVEIKTVAEQVSQITGKNFILDPRVKGKITLISTQDIAKEDIYQVFLSALQIMGFAAIEGPHATKIVPDASAKYMATPLVSSPQHLINDEYVVRVITLANVPVATMIPALRNLISPQGHLSAATHSNQLIVADSAASVARLAHIIRRIDVVPNDNIEYFRLHNASASEVVSVLSNMVSSYKPTGQAQSQLTLTADDRTNTILISGDKAHRLSLRAVIAQLDVPVATTGNTEVIYLKYQKSEDMVPVLSNIISSYYGAQVSHTQSNTNRVNRPIAKGPGASPNFNFMPPTPLSLGTTSTSTSSYAAMSGQSEPSVNEQRQATGTVIGGFGVQAEPNTNALIISAPPSLMRNLKTVIARLDIRRAQVLVEGVVVELTGSVTSDLGIEWRAGGSVIGGTSGGSIAGGVLDALQTTVDAGGSVTLPTSGLTLGFIRNGDIRFLLNALKASGASNILATPSLVALDNTPASIFVGQNVPVRTGEFLSSSSNQSEPFTTIDRRDIGLSLHLIPQITKDKAVKLILEQIVQTLDPTAGADILDPTFTTRSINTTVLVNDGDILVLGGLIRTDETQTKTQVPVFGDIPFLGHLFKSKHKMISKTNLMVFLRPVILRDRNDSIRVTGNKYNFIRDKLILNNLPPKTRPNMFKSRSTLPPFPPAYHAIILPQPRF